MKNNMIKKLLLISLLFIIMYQSNTVSTLSKVTDNFYKLQDSFNRKESDLINKYTELHEDLSEEIKKIEIEKLVAESRNTDFKKQNQELAIKENISEKTMQVDEKNLNTLQEKIHHMNQEILNFNKILENNTLKIKSDEIKIDNLNKILIDEKENLNQLLEIINKVNEEVKNANMDSKNLYNYSCEKLENIEKEMVDVDSLPILDIKY